MLYSDAKKQWHVKSDHATQVEGGDRKYFAPESEDVVDILISRGRGKSLLAIFPIASRAKRVNITGINYFSAYQQVVINSSFFLYPLFMLLPHYLHSTSPFFPLPLPPPLIEYTAPPRRGSA